MCFGLVWFFALDQLPSFMTWLETALLSTSSPISSGFPFALMSLSLKSLPDFLKLDYVPHTVLPSVLSHYLSIPAWRILED